MKYAVYFGSREIYGDMATSAKSLLINSDVDKIYFLIESDDFICDLPPSIEVRNISQEIWECGYTYNGQNVKTGWTYMGLARTALAKLLPDLDTVLSIDCDTIVDKDISDIWDIDISNYYYAAVREPTLSNRCGHLYINAGIMMCNLKKLREDKKEDEMIQLLNEKKLFFVCQDAINALCKDKILEIPNCYNKSDYTGVCYDPRVIHFAGKKRWQENEIVVKYRNMDYPR